MLKFVAMTIVGTLITATPATAANACLYGTAVWSDGSKSHKTMTISTSWNSKKAYPSYGKYELCLGSNPGKTITVYVDGMNYGRVHVNGNTRFDVRHR